MILYILYIIVGAACVLFGADKMTDGSVAVARKMRISPLVIGLTILAIGTSAPEFSVSLFSAIKGTPDMAVGNVIGSNILNILLVGGVSACVMPLTTSRETMVRQMPIMAVASVVLMVLCLDGMLSRWDCLLLFIGFVLFMIYTVRNAKESEKKGVTAATSDTAEQKEEKPYPTGKAILFILAGLSLLVLGSNVFVNGASALAKELGVSEAVIGLTIVAGGTSLPELATSVVAAYKGQTDIALGNIIGSNVFNILMALGLTGIISPMRVDGFTPIDFGIMLLSAALLWIFTFSKRTLERWDGGVLVAICVGYLWYLVASV